MMRQGLLFGNDVLNKLLDIYRDGFISGAVSGVTTVLAAQGMPVEEADRISERVALDLTAAVHDDPLMIEALRGEILERLQGIDTGPKAYTMPPHSKDERA